MRQLFTKIMENNLLRNISAGFVFQLAAMLLAFIYTPIARQYLGDSRYGVWATISSIVSWISLGDIGIGNGLRNRLTEAFANEKEEEIGKLMSTAYAVMFWICLLIFSVYFVVSRLIDFTSILNLNIKNENTDLAIKIMVGFMCINLWLGLVSQAFYAIQKPAISTFFGMIAQLLNIIIIVLLNKFISLTLPIFAMIMGGTTLLCNIIKNLYIFSTYACFRPLRTKFEKKYINSIVSVGGLLFIGQLGGMIQSNTDNILIAKMFGAEQVTPYSIAYSLFSIFVSVQGMIIMPMWSAFTLKKEKREYEWMKKSLKRMNQISIVFSIGVILAIFLIPLISDIWLQHHLEYSRTMLIIMGVFFIGNIFGQNYGSFLCGVGELKFYTVAVVTTSLLNVPLSILFAYRFGITGIILGTLASGIWLFPGYPLSVRKWFRIHEGAK